MKNFNSLSWLSCLLFTGLCLSLASCGNDAESINYPAGNSYDLVDTYTYDDTPDDAAVTIDENQVVICPTCGGNGGVVYFDGSIVPCYNCGGRGSFTVGELQAVLNATGGDSDGYGYNETQQDGSGDYMRIQLEQELSLHESNLASLYECLDVVDGSINQTYLQQQIIEEEYAIKAIKRRLENM